MALDAQVGWLATITEPGGDYVEYHGERRTQFHLNESRETLQTVDQALRDAHLEGHEEPGFAILGPDPLCLNTVRLITFS